MTRLLVTGATGFIGRAALPILGARGFEIHTVGRRKPDLPGVHAHAADLLRPQEVSDVVASVRPSHLLHLAWITEPGVYWTSADNLDWVAASLHLARCFAETGGRRAVFAGSCAEYQWGAARFHETATACVPATLYGAAKNSLRQLLMAYAATIDLSLAWGRIFYLYGPGERPGRLVSGAVSSLLSGDRFPTSEGHQRRDFLHVRDVAGAFASLLESTVEGPVNIGSGQAVAVRDLLQRIADQLERPDLLGFGDRPLSAAEPPVVEADVARLAIEAGYTPRVDLAAGLSETVEWWRQRRAC